MRNGIIAFGLLILALAFVSPGAALAAKGKAGEEGAWKVKVTPDAATAAKGEKEFDDTLTLRKGKFRSTAGEAHGFEEAPYRVEGNHWMSDAGSPKEGRTHWHGQVSGDSVEGEMTWTRAEGTVLNFTFTGSRAGEQPQTRQTPKSGD